MTTTDVPPLRAADGYARAPARAMTIAKVELKFAYLSNRESPVRNTDRDRSGLSGNPSDGLPIATTSAAPMLLNIWPGGVTF